MFDIYLSVINDQITPLSFYGRRDFTEYLKDASAKSYALLILDYAQSSVSSLPLRVYCFGAPEHVKADFINRYAREEFYAEDLITYKYLKAKDD